MRCWSSVESRAGQLNDISACADSWTSTQCVTTGRNNRRKTGARINNQGCRETFMVFDNWWQAASPPCFLLCKCRKDKSGHFIVWTTSIGQLVRVDEFFEMRLADSRLAPLSGKLASVSVGKNCRQILIESIEFWHILIWRPCYQFPLSRLLFILSEIFLGCCWPAINPLPVGRSPPCWAAALICHHHFIARQPARFCTHTLLDSNRICHYLFINSKQQLLPTKCILLKPEMPFFVNF